MLLVLVILGGLWWHFRTPIRAAVAGGVPGTPRHYIIGIAAVIVIALAVWVVPWGNLAHSAEAPSVGTVGMFFRTYWLGLLIILVAAYVLVGVWLKAAMPLVHLIAALFVVSVLWSWTFGRPDTPPPPGASASQPSKSRLLPMAPYGDTVRMSARPGHVITFVGTGFDSYCVHGNNEIEQIPTGGRCSVEAPEFWFARDTTGQPNSADWIHQPK
ncbi:MAG: hypothetical protein AAB442_01660 [Patescibacteria group bacterium]